MPEEAGSLESNVRVLVVEDDDSFRAALSDFCRQWAGLEFAGCAATVREAVDRAKKSSPHVVLLDAHIDGGGTCAVSQLRSASPASRILVLSAHDDRNTVVHMLRSGAHGYLVKGTDPQSIASGIRRVADGETALSPSVATEVLEELLRQTSTAERLQRQVSEFDQVREQILDVLAHELLTPAAVIQASVALLESNEDAEPERVLPMVRRATVRLQRLVRNIHTSAHLSQHGIDPPRLVSVGRIVATAVHGVKEVESGRLRWALPLDLGETKVLVDESLACQAVSLVVENATEAAPPGTEVRVTVRRKDRHVDVLVQDTGPGVPADVRDAIFKPLYQLDMGGTRRPGGIGVGLSLARLIMEAHRGAISLERSGEDGTIFVLHFNDPDAPIGQRSP